MSTSRKVVIVLLVSIVDHGELYPDFLEIKRTFLSSDWNSTATETDLLPGFRNLVYENLLRISA